MSKQGARPQDEGTQQLVPRRRKPALHDAAAQFTRTDRAGPIEAQHLSTSAEATPTALTAATSVASVTIDGAFRVVGDELAARADRGVLDRSTVRMLRVNLDRLAGFAASKQVHRLSELDDLLCEEWIWSRLSGVRHRGQRPSVSTMQRRRTTITSAFAVARTLELDSRYIGLDISLDSRNRRSWRPLTDDEVALIRHVAAGFGANSVTAVTVALALAGAAVGELGLVTVGDLALDEGLVWVRGTPLSTFARWLPIEDWSVHIIRRGIHSITQHGPVNDSTLIAYEQVSPCRTTTPDPRVAPARISARLALVLKYAGLDQRPGVTASSIRHWVGFTVFKETGRLEAVAARLGMVNLTLAADLLNFDWRAAYAVTPARKASDNV